LKRPRKKARVHRKPAEPDRIRQSQICPVEYCEAIAATVHEAFLALDEKLHVIRANSVFYKTFGLTPELVAKTQLFELGNGEWNIPRLRSWLAHEEDSFLEGLEVEGIFGPAGRKTLSINARRIPASGPLRMVLIAMQDISARRAAERAARQTQASFSAFTREAPVGVIETGPEGDCIYINTHACRMIELDFTSARGLGWVNSIHPDDLPVFVAKRDDSRRTMDVLSTELRLVSARGRTTWSNLILIPRMDNNNVFAGHLIAITDITDRKDLEERLAQGQKMEAIGRLAGGVAHDFNNILTAISSYATQLEEIVPENDAARNLAVQINKVVEQAAAVTRQLLAFSRKQLLRPTRVDINTVLRETQELLRRLLGDSIEIVFAYSPCEEAVKVDLGQLQQVILNIAINARDAITDRGSLTISTSHVRLDEAAARQNSVSPGEYVVLSFRDTGLGMDAEILDRVFEPFFTTKPLGAGTGLGLSTVYGIVKQSGGSVSITSQPNKGTTVRIYLPRETPEEANEAAERRIADAGGSETVLLVEDAAVVRSLVRELLEERGYRVLEARDPQEALTIAGNHEGKIELLLTDFVMPRMSGQELARRLRLRRKDIRVIYMSGYSGAALHAVESDGNFLEKPFKPDELASFVRNVLDEPLKEDPK